MTAGGQVSGCHPNWLGEEAHSPRGPQGPNLCLWPSSFPPQGLSWPQPALWGPRTHQLQPNSSHGHLSPTVPPGPEQQQIKVITSIGRALFSVKCGLEEHLYLQPPAPQLSFREVQGPSPAVLCSVCGQNTAWGLSRSGSRTPRPDQAHPGLGGRTERQRARKRESAEPSEPPRRGDC